MSVWSVTPEERRRWKLFNGKQHDPATRGRKSGVPYFRKNSARVLGPDDYFPLGPHMGKTLRQVPPDYLAWVDAQPWAREWHLWEPVRSYIERYILPSPEDYPDFQEPHSSPVLFVSAFGPAPADAGHCFEQGMSKLHTLPGWEDALHTFANYLGLRESWYQRRRVLPPHYRLTHAKHQRVLDLGVQLCSPRALAGHASTWADYYNSRRQPAEESTTP